MNTHRYTVRLLLTSILASGMSLAYAQSADEASADPAPLPARFEALPDGNVFDKNTNLTWAGKNKLGDISWADARDYCSGMGAGWSLPSTDDLQSLYMPDLASKDVCMGKLSCNITSLIEVTGLTLWSAENDATGSWYVYFADGKKYPANAENTQGKRALCVRRP